MDIYILLCFDFLCFLRRRFSVNLESHSSHGYFTPSCIDIICRLRSACWVPLKSHSLHGYFTPSCIDLLCLLRGPFWVNLESHSSHGYFTHLSHWYLTPYMNPKMAFFSKFRVTFIAWIFHTFMQCQNMSLEMCLPSTFEVTCIAWILESTLHCCCCVCNNQGLLMRCLI